MIYLIRTIVMAVLLSSVVSAQNQLLVTEIQLRTDPAGARVRPYESLVVQVLAYGEVTDAEGKKTKVRLREGGAKVALKNSNAGWLSKPFRYQGKESESFYSPEGTGLGALIFGRAQASYVLQDSVLFTASDRPGQYTIEATLNGKTASATVHVDRNAPSLKPKETTNFAGERSFGDRYRSLVEHYAPFVAQETWFQPKSDYLARFDLDGDWRGDNNWDKAFEGSSQAYVHYAVMETDTHWFLVYNFFHPRDYSDKCVVGTCHENDNEGLILTVAKDGSPHGRLQVMETLAHNNIYSYRNDRKVRKNVHNLDGDIELYQDSHPVIFIEAGGHGVFGSKDSHSHFSLRRNEFTAGTGVTYAYKGRAERPRHGNDRNIGYELLSIHEHWWQRAQSRNASRERTFDAFYSYEPYGGRPGAGQAQVAGSFYGRKHGSNKAKPFWGWHDRRTRKKKVLATGQWGLDPAYGVSQNLRMPPPFSVNYIYNPYLGIGGPGVTAPAPPAAPTPQPPVYTQTSPRPSPTPLPSASPPAFRARPSSNFDPGSKKGRFDLRLLVDGEIDVLLQGDGVRYAVHNGRVPRDMGSEYSQPVPRAAFRKFLFDKKDGRGTVRLLEEPTAANQYTAKLKISDPKGGDDRYHVRVEWERDGPVSQVAPPPPRSRAGASRTGTSNTGKSQAGIFARHPRSAQPGSVPPAALPVTSPAASPAPSPAPSLEAPSVASPFPSQDQVAGIELFSDENDPRKYDRDDEGDFEFKGRVDGTVILRLRGNRVFVETLSGRPLKLDWFEFSQPLPAGTLKKIELDKKDGRGEVVLVERPWTQNQFMAVVQISDPKGGDAKYRFNLKWKQ